MLLRIIAAAFLAGAWIAAGSTSAQAEPRLALVIGQGAYANGELPTAANDAGLVGQTLTSAGFEVIQGRDLNQADLRRIVRDFLDGVQTATPDSSVVIYFAGHALQVEGENYLLPTDARVGRESDIPIEGYRVSDIVRSLSATPGATRIVIVDAAQEYPLPRSAQVARGLTLIEPPPSFLVAFAAAPGAFGPAPQPPYGVYATALVEMMREPGIAPDDLFGRVRLRVHDATRGRQVPWHAANLNAPFAFFEPAEATAAAPRRAPRRIAALPPEEAYAIAVEWDTIESYQEFLRAYSDHPLSRRMRVLLAARREAMIWRRTVLRNTPEAYWTYLSRYPQGPHGADARRRLTRLSAPVAPPPDFDQVSYGDLPPPLPGESYEVREAVYLDDLPPPPRAPVYLLPERDEEIVRLAAPPPSPGRGILPIPIPIPIPIRARPPAEFRPPIAPITPQGAVTIPVARPPPRGQTAPAWQGQPGLRGPITPLVQQPPQPAQPGAAAGPAPVTPAETVPGRPASLPPGAPAARAPGARPGAIIPAAPGAASPGGAPGQPARPGAIPMAPGGAPGAATSPPSASPPQAPAGVPAARAPTQSAPQSRAPEAAGQQPRPGTPGQGASANAPTRPGRPGPARVQSPADRGLPPELQGRGRISGPGGPQRPAAPQVQRPAAPAVAQPQRPAAPPPAVAAPRPIGRPAAPPATQAPRPAGPLPGAAAAPRPAGPPPSAQGGGPAKPAGSGGAPKCVLPNGQPCPPPGSR